MDIERELLARLDAMEKHLSVVSDELIRYRRERFLKSVGIIVLVVLPIVGLGFLVPNFISRYAYEAAPTSARPMLQTYLPVEVEKKNNETPKPVISAPATAVRATDIDALPLSTSSATSSATSTGTN